MDLAELILDENIDQVLALNTHYEVIAWNKACELTTGIKKRAIIGKNILEFFPQMVKDAAIMNSLDHALKGFQSFVPNGHSSYNDGQLVERHFIPLKNTQETVTGILIVTHDVAHRVKAENKLRALNKSLENFKLIIDSANDIIVTFDVDGKITYWNAAAEKLFGYTAEEMTGTSLACLMTEEDDGFLTELMNGLKAGIAVNRLMQQRTRSGTYIDVAVNIFPLIDESNIFIGGCQIARDFTEIIDYQKSIEKLNNELTVKNRQLASVHSELKTFSHIAVNSYSETLRQLYLHFEYIVTKEASKLSDSGKANIRKAQAAIQKMKLLTDDIIAFGRLSEFDTEVKSVDLNIVFATILNDMQESGKTTNVEFNVDPLPVINGYPFLISLIFHHLIDNACKFRNTKEQTTVHISYQRKKGNVYNKELNAGQYYKVIIIKDNGIGFAADQKENIFQIFTRLHPDKYKGSGIGLAICSKAMELHGSFIVAESSVGKGSAFHCCFPENA